MTRTKREAKRRAGRLGGLATVRKHGRAHMRTIGRRGGLATRTRYKTVPVGTSRYALVCRQTGIIKATF